ncbi:MAG: DNA polymerase I [Candidatus Omnitrophota bacterium]|nr:DNA polymerase I [Candidatus Omnitrophota bacterium]
MQTFEQLYLFDATAFYYRAFYALQGLSTSSGLPVGAVYGFINMLNKVLKSGKAESAVLCFDVSRKTFRSEKFAEYKIQRPPMPEGLVSQLSLIREAVSAYRLRVCELQGYEADDLLAALSKKASAAGINTVIVSPDKDILQLVDGHTLVLNPYKGSGVLYDAAAVEKDFGVSPCLVPQVLALMGDQSDNIPGVPGIGQKTAVALLKEHGSLEEILAHPERIKQEKIRNAVAAGGDMIRLNLELVTLDGSAPVELEPEACRITEPDYGKLRELFTRLEFRSLLKTLPETPGAGQEQPVPGGDDAACAGNGDVVIRPLDTGDFMIYACGMVFSSAEIGENLKRILESDSAGKYGHDLKRAAGTLRSRGIILRGMRFDSMIAAYLLNPSSGGYSFDDIYSAYGEGLPGSASGTEGIKGLNARLRRLLEEKELLKLFEEIEMPLAEVLAGMEADGIKVDVSVLRELSSEMEKKILALTSDIYECAGGSFNINSPQQLRVVLFEKLKLPVRKRTKTGPSTDEEVLRGLVEEHRLPAMLLEYRQLAKLKSTYVDALLNLADKATLRIHTCFNQTGTETGRLSSSDPNLQNIPVRSESGRRIRRAFVASETGNELFSCDYSQIELRILAHLSGDSGMINAFVEDKDIHAHTASLIYGVPEKDVDDAMRETAKRVNFGIIYGQSGFGLGKDLGITVREAESFIDAYFLRYPGVKEFIDGRIAFAEREGFVATILGRRRYLPEINSGNMAVRQFARRKAVNTPVQGSASDLIKAAMISIQRLIAERGLRSRMLLQVHDELIFDVPRAEAETFIPEAERIMGHVLELSVPLKVSVKKGPNLCDLEDYVPVSRETDI